MSFDARRQRRRFAAVDLARMAWIEGTLPVRTREAAIFGRFAAAAGPVLEIGAGDGLTLRFRPELADLGYIGTDLELARARAIRAHAPAGSALAAVACDAAALPFADHSVGTVLCRDVLHHMAPVPRQHAIAEMARVLDAGGEAIVIEPNGLAFWMAAFALAQSTERGLLDFNRQTLGDALRQRFARVEVAPIEPSGLYRALLHYRLGLARLGRWRLMRRALVRWEALVERAAPPALWTYLYARCSQPR